MRRLPIFLLLDVSESMAGKPIRDVQDGIAMLTDALLGDPFAIETVYISVIAFAGKAKTVTPLTYILDFVPPKLPVGSGTNLTNALKTLMHEIDANVKKNTPQAKGDWKPLVFILTDGTPNDDCRAAAHQWKRDYGKCSTVAVLMGENSDASALKSITDNVLVFKETTKESYQAFFKWVSSSIQTSSKAIGEIGAERPGGDLDAIRRNLEADLLADGLPTENNIDYFVLPVKCQSTGKPYIIRYISKNKSRTYKPDGAYPVDGSYSELSSGEGEGKRVSIEQIELENLPSCPYCENAMLGQCSCGKWLCVNPKRLKNVKCPHCGSLGDFEGSVSDLHGGRG